MRLSVALLCLLLPPAAHAADLEVLVATEDGWAPAVTTGHGFSGQPGLPIPLTTRSELVQTLESGMDGFGLRISSSEFIAIERLELLAIPHGSDEEVLDVDGQLMIAGPPSLLSADGRLARQDGIMATASGLELREAPEGEVALAIGSWSHGRSARRYGAEVLGQAPIDMLFAARLRTASLEPGTLPVALVDVALVTSHERTETRAVRPSAMPFGRATFGLEERMPLGLEPSDLRGRVIGRGRSLELFLDPPQLAEDEASSWTLVVTLDSRPAAMPDGVPAPWHPVEDELPVPLFTDQLAEAAGDLVHIEGPTDQRDIRPTMGPGVAIGDVDRDGFLDLYIAGGGGREEERGFIGRLSRQLRTSEDRGPMRFETVTPSGLEVPGFGMGALLFDADGDGDLDLYQANYGADFLFANQWGREGAPFSAVPAADFERDKTGGWSAGLAAGDVDLDGDLDLYVTSYLVYDESLMPDDGELRSYAREDPIAMLPFAFPGGRNLFFDNTSDTRITLVDKTDEYGLADEQGRGMQACFWDFDSDGDVDLYVANDVSPNRLWRNEILGPSGKGSPGFKDVSFSTGMDDPRGGMGVDVGDTDGDGDEDLFLTNWNLEPNALYRNNLRSHKSTRLHKATFRDTVVQAGLAPYGVGTTSWGAVLFDADCDRDLDLFIPNGYTSPDYKTTGICVGQANQLFLGDGRGHFEDHSFAAGPDVLAKLASRAAAAADFDQDGDLDLVVTNNNGPAQLLVNQTRQLGTAGHFLIVRLESPSKNRFGIGAEVRVVTLDEDGQEQALVRSLLAGKNYLAGNPPELFFGLGAATEVKRVEVRWPSGETSEHGPGPADTVVTLRQPR